MLSLTEGASRFRLAMVLRGSHPWQQGYHVTKAVIHHKSVGFTGGQHHLFMIDRICETFSPA
jgi:hypothetical protein